MAASSPVLVVADASVLTQWFLPDESTCPGTERLMTDVGSGKVSLLEPPLLAYELTNALSMAVKRHRIPDQDASLARRAFANLGVVFSNPHWQGPASLRLSLVPGVTAYDASYIALAEDHHCFFYTADKRLAAAVRQLSGCVQMISEY